MMTKSKRFVLRLWVLSLVASTMAVGAFASPASADEFSVEDTLTLATADTTIEDGTRMRWNWDEGPGQDVFFRMSITRNFGALADFNVDTGIESTKLCTDLFDPIEVIENVFVDSDECRRSFATSTFPTIPEAVTDFVSNFNTFLADNERGERLSASESDGMMTISYLVPRTDGTLTVTTEFFGASSPVSSPVNLQIDGATIAGATDVENGGTTGAVVVTPAGHTAAQAAGTGTDLADFITTYSCVEDTNPASPIIGDGTMTTSIDIAVGDDWVCTFTNNKVPPILCGGAEVTVDMSKGDMPTEGDDVIRGTVGPDVINGLGGNDIICSLQGDDTINAGGGFDQVFAGSGADFVVGGVGNDKLVGGSGDDEILGEGGNDRIQGGPGVDMLDGGNGSDRIAGGTGNDILRGGKFADDLLGGLGRDQLFGDEGDDVLRGGAWIDVMDGGPQNDGCTLTDPSGFLETRVNCETGVFGR